VEVLAPDHGVSARGTSDDTLISGDVLRKLLVKMESRADPTAPKRPPRQEPSQPVKVRARASRRAVKQVLDEREAEARARQVAEQLVAWYNDSLGPALLSYARLGPGRRLHILDTTRLEVALETGTYECSGVVKNDDGTLSRGDKLATIRTLLDTAGSLTQVAVSAIQAHALTLCRPLLETSPVLRAGDMLLEERGFLDGKTITYLKQTRHVDVIIPLKASILSCEEAMTLAEMAGMWQPHPSREGQQIALVEQVEHMWEDCHSPLNACVIRFWNSKKSCVDYIVLVTTDLNLSARWIVHHYEERPEIEQDYEQMKSGGWQLKKLTSTRYSEIVFYVLTVVLSYSLYHLFANTQAGARFAEKTRQAIAFEQLRTQRTHVIVYAGGYFEVFETLRFVHLVLQLPAPVQERLRLWLGEHLNTTEQRE